MRKTVGAIKREIKTNVVCDIPRAEKEVYRISRKEIRRLRFVEIRIFRRAIEDYEKLTPTTHGIWIEGPFIEDIIDALIKATQAPPVERQTGRKYSGVCIEEFPVTEYDSYRVVKDCGFVEIRRFMKNCAGRWTAYCRKGVDIYDDRVHDVIKGLKRAASA